MRRYSSKKSYTWNSDIAYIAGLFAADGCLYNDGRHLNLTSKDIDLLETVRKILELRGSVKAKSNGYGGLGYYIQFSNVSLYDFLNESGIMPAKSKIINEVKVPDKFYADFLRGYFDGDGCVYGFWDKRWKNSLMYYTEYASASKKFLSWISKKNRSIAGTSLGTIQNSTRVMALSYAKNDSRILFNFMYYDSNLPHLERKRLKFIDLLSQDPYAGEELLGRVAELADAYA